MAETRQWRTLLHVRGETAQADGRQFFFSPRGRSDAAAELDATLEAFFAPPADDATHMHPQCRFPARHRFLRARLGIDPMRLPAWPCPRFAAWRDNLGARGVTLLFSSAYLNSPASMYGHTFLRLDQSTAEGAPHLADHAVNFAAEAWTTNPILYAGLGLLGGFEGRYSSLPYYMKVHEYNDLEHRDLWEYPLALSAEEVDRLVEHLWEIGATHFDYYFFTANCSYQLLTLLEAAAPRLDLTSGARFRVKAIPADTLRRVLEVPGLAGKPKLRPSHVRLLLARRALLEPAEREHAERLGGAGGGRWLGAIAALPAARQALVLDAALDYLRYRDGLVRSKRDHVSMAQERLLQLARRKLGLRTEAPTVTDAGEPPEAQHATSRVSAGGGTDSGAAYGELSLRGAMHDLYDDPAGFIGDSTLEMMQLSLRFSERHPVLLERATLVNVESLMHVDEWIHKASWRLRLGSWRLHDRPCDGWGCTEIGAQGGAGASGRFGRLALYALAEGLAGAGPAPRDGFRLAGGFRTGLIADGPGRSRAMLEWGAMAPLVGDDVADVFVRGGLQWPVAKWLAVRAEAERNLFRNQLGGSLLGYF